MSAMEAAEARLNEEERAAAEAGASQDMRLRPVIGAVDVFEEDEEVPPKDVGRCAPCGCIDRELDDHDRIFLTDGPSIYQSVGYELSLWASLQCNTTLAPSHGKRGRCRRRQKSVSPGACQPPDVECIAWPQGAQHAAGVPASGAVPPDASHLGGHLRLGVPGPRRGASRQDCRPQKGAKRVDAAGVTSQIARVLSADSDTFAGSPLPLSGYAALTQQRCYGHCHSLFRGCSPA